MCTDFSFLFNIISRILNIICIFYRINFEYNLPFRKSGRTHGAKAKISQIPLRLAFALTGHKMQGTTIKRGTNLIIYGHKRMPPALGFVMLSRCEDISNVFLDESFDIKKISCVKEALIESYKLEKRSFEPIGKFDICVMNIQSARCHFEDILNDADVLESKILCLTETWLYPEEIENFQIPQKNLHHSSIGNGKGCMMYSVFDLNNVTSITTPKFQMICCEIQEKLQILLAYVSKGVSLIHLVSIIEEHMNQNMDVMLVGDFNFNAEESNHLTNWLNKKNFKQTVTVPTQKKGNILDHCYVKSSFAKRITITPVFKYYTDHAALCIRFNNFEIN